METDSEETKIFKKSHEWKITVESLNLNKNTEL